MSSISLWTPVKYDIQSTTRWQKARQLVDEYFNLGGEVAIVCGKKLNGVEPVVLQPGQTVRWQTALKAASYMAFLFFRAANLLFPGLPLIPGMVVVQTVISCLPIAMLVMKAVLRFKSHFYLYANVNDDLIQPQLKVTLDELLGRYGSVDRLPVYELAAGESKVAVDKMKASIMKGIITNSSGKNPYIAIKMLRLVDQDKKVLYLYPNLHDRPLMWSQVSHYSPYFFDSNFTYESGKVTTRQAQENFPRLQRMIQEGKATDLNDVEWEIIGHQKNKEINS